MYELPIIRTITEQTSLDRIHIRTPDRKTYFDILPVTDIIIDDNYKNSFFYVNSKSNFDINISSSEPAIIETQGNVLVRGNANVLILRANTVNVTDEATAHIVLARYIVATNHSTVYSYGYNFLNLERNATAHLFGTTQAIAYGHTEIYAYDASIVRLRSNSVHIRRLHNYSLFQTFTKSTNITIDEIDLTINGPAPEWFYPQLEDIKRRIPERCTDKGIYLFITLSIPEYNEILESNRFPYVKNVKAGVYPYNAIHSRFNKGLLNYPLVFYCFVEYKDIESNSFDSADKTFMCKKAQIIKEINPATWTG